MIIGALSEIAKISENEDKKKSQASSSNKSHSTQGEPTNWLGRAFDEVDAMGRQDLDIDGDGFADWQEKLLGTDPSDKNSFSAPRTVLRDLLTRSGDSDADGLKDSDDPNAESADSDADGALDGCEIHSGSDPSQRASVPNGDFDADGLSFKAESAIGANPRNPDSDGDGLSDCLELALGTGILDMDSDNDGIFDGTEVRLQSDPTHPENIDR